MKEKLTEHAVRLFDEKGFTVTSIQDIVESIGVTKGTFYYYFSSKEELLMDIHMRYIDGLLAKQNRVLDDEGKSYSEKLLDIVHLSIVDIKEQGASAKVFFREMRHLSKKSLDQIEPKRDMYRFNIEKLLKEGRKNGEFREGFDASIVAFGILGMMNWSYQWYKPNGAKSDTEIAETFVDMVLTGIESK
ncbi:TetR/AcrR family transcriptional regulator [Bacillus sp. BHET2]|uniref:TetR/AcrR family transcriptional regulator n=1 Tax=Bacillus sp. BHET2 TaxID=2583818 RepID=UPI00110D915E|nr:TetR/AcrR family transcriptional regulator [Bacillus sp. BHET2]TMU87379.1 TetR/AcrR family transcriptional regulator [Bacillus sp. BHET2]